MSVVCQMRIAMTWQVDCHKSAIRIRLAGYWTEPVKCHAGAQEASLHWQHMCHPQLGEPYSRDSAGSIVQSGVGVPIQLLGLLTW